GPPAPDREVRLGCSGIKRLRNSPDGPRPPTPPGQERDSRTGTAAVELSQQLAGHRLEPGSSAQGRNMSRAGPRLDVLSLGSYIRQAPAFEGVGGESGTAD